MAGARIRVLLADDHTLLRQGLRAILDKEADIRIVAEAANGRDVVNKATAFKPDIVVMDISMPRCTGIEATQMIRTGSPATQVVALSMHDSDEQVEAVLQAGARGYVLKDAPARELLAAIRAVNEGGMWIHPRISMGLVAKYLKGRPRPEVPGIEPPPKLSLREEQVLRLIAAGKTTREIADELKFAVKTGVTHRTRLMQKLKAHNAVQLLENARKYGFRVN